MRIRTLVPALACLAAAPVFLAAADAPAAAPVPVKLDGFVDTIYSWSDAKTDSVSTIGTGFQYFAKLGAEITISDKIAGQVDITNNGNAYAGDNTVYIRQAYGTWAVTPDVTFKSGRFIDAIGWTSAYAPGIYRVNVGPITSLYGVDSAVGADIKYAKGDITLEGSIVNGIFGEGTGAAAQPAGQKNYGYGYIADLSYALPDKKGVLDFEAAYDADGASSVGDPTATNSDFHGGTAYHLGANATITPNDATMVGLEAIYQKIKAPTDKSAIAADQKNVGLQGQVNYKIPKAPWSASVTGSLEYVKKTNIALLDGDTSKATEVAVAVLTNPTASDKFGVNAEIGYTKGDSDTSGTSTSTKSWAFTLEALYIIP